MAKSRTRAEYESEADRIWRNYIVPGTMADIREAKNDDELRGAIAQKVWVGAAKSRPNERRGANFSDKFLDFIVERAYKQPKDTSGKPFLQFTETEIRRDQRKAHSAEIVERARMFKRIQDTQSAVLKRRIFEYLAKGEAKQAAKRRKIVKPLKFVETMDYNAHLKTTRKDSMKTQGMKQKMAVTRALQGPQASRHRVVTSQNYGAHLRRSAVATQSNKTASILNRLSKLETNSRKKPLSTYKRL